jgi:hypothetical protein
VERVISLENRVLDHIGNERLLPSLAPFKNGCSRPEVLEKTVQDGLSVTLENRVWEREQPVRCCLVSKNGVLA